MSSKRIIPILLVCASLMALFTSGCCWDRHDRHGGGHRRLSLDLKVGAPSAQAEVASS
jgi:hypothetical protein